MGNRLAKLRGAGLAVQSAVLGLALLGTYLVAAPVAWWLSADAGLAAAGVAAGLCFAGTFVALAISRFFTDPVDAWKAMLLGIFPRMGLPLAGGIAIQFLVAPLAESGLLVYLVIFYQVALGTEALLCLPSGSSATMSDKTAEVGGPPKGRATSTDAAS